ncbi:MAG: trypsin-like peptidase domain-containing protein [Thermoleophilia bacterium]|nr:trypsin-like peptidase domain-containing protein [Thermoleophilia bacterium]
MPSAPDSRNRRAGLPMRWPLLITLIVLLGLLIASCGSNDGLNDDDGLDAKPPAATAPPEKSGDPVVIDTTGEAFNAARIYRDAVPGVISVRSIFSGSNSPFGVQVAGGSGFVLNDDGELITNAHVISDGEGENRTPAKEVYVEFYDGNVLPAEILGFDPFADVALLKVDPNEFDLKPLELADSDNVVVGQPIAVIGSPFGEDHSLSTGVVSQTNRSVRSLTDFQIEGAIQTDASINPGSSGGPMLDGQGRVIGISQQIKGGSGASDGVGFGVPSNAIEYSSKQLEEDGEANYAYIGVSTQPLYPQLAEKLGIEADSGALVAKVIPDGPADDAGIKGSDDRISFQGSVFDTGGDVIVSINGERIEKAEDLGRIVGGLEPGETVDLGVVRDDREVNVKVDLEERPTAITAP